MAHADTLLGEVIQPKLLRALQEREFEQLGSTNTRRVNIRLNRSTFLSRMKKFGIDLALACYDVAGNASQAGRAWTQLLTAKKSDPHRSRISTQNRGNSTLAMELYYEALKLDPIDVTATNNLAILLAKSGQLPAAENLWQKTFDLNEDIDELGINLALAECMLRNKNAAQRVLQRALLYSPDQQIARRKLQAIQSGQETCAAPASAF